MLRSIFAILILSGSFFIPTSANAEMYKWKTVGANPYEGSMEWALQRSGFSRLTNEKLRLEMESGNGIINAICGGEVIKFTTFGKDGIRYNVLADWEKTECYTTTEYSVVNGNYSYTLMYVWKCGNWSGKSVEIVEDDEIRPIVKIQKDNLVSLSYDGNSSILPTTPTPDVSDTSSDGNISITSTSTSISNTNAQGNPGNDNPTGNGGESPNGSDFGGGSKGKGDVNGSNGKGKGGGKGGKGKSK